MKRLAIANARVVQGILQTGIKCTDALAVISQHAQEDPDKNAFVLFQMIKARFTRTANDRAQALSKLLNGLSANFKEEPKILLDRFDALCRKISAIDRALLPTDVFINGNFKMRHSREIQTFVCFFCDNNR